MLVLGLGLAGCPGAGGSAAAGPAPVLSPSDLAPRGVPVAVIRTERGSIRIVLFDAAAPRTVANFVDLVAKGFYNGLTFHHVVPGLLAEGGDPKGDGSGGPGYVIKGETNAHRHVTGALAMARRDGPDTAGSQFYVCLKDLPELDGTTTVFGQVSEGLDVVQALQKGDRIVEIRMEWVPPETVPAEWRS